MSRDYSYYQHDVELKLRVAPRLWNVYLIHLYCQEPDMKSREGFAHIGVWQCESGSIAYHGRFARALEGAIMLYWDMEFSPTSSRWRAGANTFAIGCYNSRD